MQQDEPLIVPLTFNAGSQSSLSLGCTHAKPTSFVGWSSINRPIAGAALGCDDGSAYIFHAVDASPPLAIKTDIQRSPANTNPLPAPVPLITSPTPKRLKANSTSRPPTPTRAQTPTPFSITPRAKIVSALSKEQVEAPKNYVDYDDEPEKLKNLLKTRAGANKDGASSRTRADSDTSARTDRQHAFERTISVATTYTIASTRPTSPTTTGTPGPSSPKFASPQVPTLALHLHVHPPHLGPGHALTALQASEDSKQLFGLQESGSISILLHANTFHLTCSTGFYPFSTSQMVLS